MIRRSPLSPAQRVQVAAVAIALSVFAVMLGMCVACGSAQTGVQLQNPAQAAEVLAMGAALTDCAVGSATRSQAQACQAQVVQQFCGPGGILAVQGGCGPDAAVPSTVPDPTLSKLLDRGLEAGWVTMGSQEAAAGVVQAIVGDAGGQ